MGNVVGFSGTITESLKPIGVDMVNKKLSDGVTSDRFFEGIVSAEVVDTQNEITIRDELAKALPIWLKRGGAISNVHTNQIVGKGLGYEEVDVKKNGRRIPAIKMQGYIHKDNPVDDMVWNNIVSGEYRGLSFGGATRSAKDPVRHADGSVSYMLKDLDVMEVAVCKKPSCALALITDYNKLAKTHTAKELNSMDIDIRTNKSGQDEIVVKCDRNICYVEHSAKVINKSANIDNKMSSTVTEENKSVEALESAVTKLTEIVAKGMEAQTTFADQIEKKFAKLERKMEEEEEGHKEDDKDDDEKDDEEENGDDDYEGKDKSVEPANTLDMSNGKKNVKLPDDDIDAHDSPSSSEPSTGEAGKDKISIEEKDALLLDDLMQAHPNWFEGSVQKSADYDERDIQKTYTPKFTTIAKDADDIIENSTINNEMAALTKSGGSPEMMERMREKMKNGDFGTYVEGGSGTGVVF